MCDRDPESRSINFGVWRRARRHLPPEPHQRKKATEIGHFVSQKEKSRFLPGWTSVVMKNCFSLHYLYRTPFNLSSNNSRLAESDTFQRRGPTVALSCWSTSLPPSPCRHMLACLVLIIPLRAPDGSTHAENITGKTFACDLNPSLLLHHANKSVQRHY